MEIKGRIINVLPEKSGVSQHTGQPWRIREYVIEEVDTEYPNSLFFSVFGEEKIDQLDIQRGQVLTAHLDSRVKEYNGRYYNEIRCYRVTRGEWAEERLKEEKEMQETDRTTAPYREAPAPQAPAPPAPQPPKNDELPF